MPCIGLRVDLTLPREMRMRAQKKLRRGRKRKPMSTALIRKIEMRVKTESRKWGVSRSFIIAAALADIFGIREQERPEDGV